MICYNHEKNNIKLVMTLLVRNEEEIVEQNIRFHCHMGIDGVIVTNHNSSDNTLTILNKLKNEGLVLEIITVTEQSYLQKKWVNRMIRLARDKYKADWVLNADADEFFFADSLNIKDEIAKNPIANIITINSTIFYPSERDEYLDNPYFYSKVHEGFKKTLHQTKGFRTVTPGNHVAHLKDSINIVVSTITIYHFNVRNYQGYEDKIKRYAGISKVNKAVQRALKLLSENKLKENYNNTYGIEKRNLEIEKGLVIKDYRLANYLKQHGII